VEGVEFEGVAVEEEVEEEVVGRFEVEANMSSSFLSPEVLATG